MPHIPTKYLRGRFAGGRARQSKDDQERQKGKEDNVTAQNIKKCLRVIYHSVKQLANRERLSQQKCYLGDYQQSLNGRCRNKEPLHMLFRMNSSLRSPKNGGHARNSQLNLMDQDAECPKEDDHNRNPPGTTQRILPQYVGELRNYIPEFPAFQPERRSPAQRQPVHAETRRGDQNHNSHES